MKDGLVDNMGLSISPSEDIKNKTKPFSKKAVCEPTDTEDIIIVSFDIVTSIEHIC